MAKVVEPITDEQLKKITVANLRKEYEKLADFYRKIINGEIIKCNKCGEWKSAESYYQSNETADGIEHYACKACILNECTDYDSKTKIRTDNKDKTIETFKKLDWYFNEPVYLDQMKSLNEGTGEKIRSTAIQQWIVMCRSLYQYKGLHFKDSEFTDDSEIIELTSNRKPRKEILKLFGSGFTNTDYLYLQDQYDDWRARTQVDSKSQETYIMQICLQLLDIDKDRKNGKDVSNKLKALDTLMNAANLQPKQNVSNAATDTLTFSQLIAKWELEEPIPEPDPELCDVSGIGKNIRVWFSGWLANALGLDIPQSKEYLDEVAKYTVEKPENKADEGDNNSSSIYSKMFGNNE